jgi:hypothetical protein
MDHCDRSSDAELLRDGSMARGSSLHSDLLIDAPRIRPSRRKLCQKKSALDTARSCLGFPAGAWSTKLASQNTLAHTTEIKAAEISGGG